MTARRRGALAALLLVIFPLGCAKPAQPAARPAPRTCTIETTMGTDRPIKERQFPSSYWFSLLVSSYRSTGILVRPVRDCSGQVATVVDDTCGRGPWPATIPNDRLTDDDLLVVDAGGPNRLVWVKTDRLPDGQAEGPVALVEITERGMTARALGLLRAYPEQMTLRLARVGSDTLLVAEGERCVDREALGGCIRAIRFLLQRENRFVAIPIADDKGTCVGGAFLALRESGTDKSSKDRYRLETAVSFSSDEITLHEQLTISAAKANGFMRQVRSDRRLRLRDGRLEASGPALVARWLAQSGQPARDARDTP